MMYQISYNGEFIYGSDENKTVLNPTLEVELNSAGTLTLTIPVENEAWNNFEVFRGEVEVYEGDDIIWFGRPLQIVRDWKNQKVVTCEGALAYFNDSLQVTKEYKQAQTPLYTDATVYPGKTGFINDIIGLHNDQVESDRKIYIGEIDVDNELVYRYVDYETTADILQRMCLDTNGGYFIIRKALDEVSGQIKRYLDWRKEMPYSTDQPIQFGLNLLDLNQDLNGADICTVLLPTGENDLNISTVQVYSEDDPNHPPYHINDPEGDVLHGSGSVYMTHLQGYKRFGRVVKTKDFNNIADKNSLFQKAAEWLNEQNVDVTTIECSAADLHYLNEYSDYGKLRIGQLVQVGSTPHDLSKELPIYKISMKLDSGAKTITMGTPPKRELTDIVKSNGGSTRGSSGATGSGSASDGGSGGSTYVPVTDVKVKMPGSTNFGSVVSKKVAKIDLSELGGGDVTDVKVNDESVVDENGVANITMPVPPDVPVQDVQVDDESIVDQNGIAKLYSSDFGTTVIANPAGASTDDLETIQIGSTIYDISGGGGSSSNYGKFTCDLLFANDPLPSSPTSGKTDVDKTYALSHSIDAYDAVYVIGYLYFTSSGKNQLSSMTIFKKDYYERSYTNITFLLNGTHSGGSRRLFFEFTDDTHIFTRSNRTTSDEEPILYKVYGLKFQNKLINRSDIYSEDEQMIGRWTNGKPLYQKTIIHNGTLTKDSSWHTITHNVSNIEKCVSLIGTLRNTADDRQYEIGIFRPSDKGITLSVDSTNIYYTNNWIDTIDSVTFTLQYTKTTDAAGSGVLPEDPQIVTRSTIYSEDEQLVGRWIDGKPLYQKTFNFGTLPNDTYKDVSTGLTNVKIIKSEGYSRSSSGTVELPYVSVTSVGASIGYTVLSDNTIRISTGSDRTAFAETYITLWYTKTTDAPGSGFIPEDPQLVYMSDYYSEDEQVVGRWADGKPLYQRTYVKFLTDLARGSASSSQIRGALEGLIPSDADIVNIVDELSFLQIPWGSSNSSIRSVSLNYPNGSTYIRTNIQENNDSGRFIYIDITYSASQMYQYYMNTTKIVITLQYTKTTDAAGTGPTKGNLIYLPALYSKEEREVGVWHDGKPMYQKTFEGTSQITTSGDEIPVQLDLQNVDKICNFWGGMFNPNVGNYQQNRNQSGLYFVPYMVNAAGLSYWKIGSTWASAQYGSDQRYRITVQYTKTTDQPGSGTWTPEGQLAHHYSTSEHIVGTWIDGSTVYEKSWDFGSNILIGANTWDTSLNIDSTNINVVLEAHGNHADGTMYALEVDPTRSSHTLLGLRAPNQANIRYFTLRYTKM